MLVFTGFSRTASDVAGEQIKETPNRKQELTEMFRMVDEAISILKGKSDINDFGRLLHESWQLKRSLTNKISNPYTDFLYDAAMKAGATGGKLLGAGGGGFVLFFVKPEFQPQVREALGSLLYVPFHFENSGSQIIFYEPDMFYGKQK
jgi:D-glycero-alpha-D-manno-heptose-7-phosphate kinase